MLWVDPTLLLYGAIFLTQHQQLNIFLIIELFHISFFLFVYLQHKYSFINSFFVVAS